MIDWDKREDELYRIEKQKLIEQNEHVKMLYDKSIAGDKALRPSDEFIEQNVGKILSDHDIIKQAASSSEELTNQEKAQAAQNPAFREHLEKHQRDQEQQPDSQADRLARIKQQRDAQEQERQRRQDR